MKILFLGAPGSGKSTQGQLLADESGAKWISSGQMLRESKEEWIQEKLKTGELFDDEFITEMMLGELKSRDDYILDGFPRTKIQAERMLEAGIKLDKIIEIDVPVEELVKRMLLRGRGEDNEEVIGKRVSIYESTRDDIMEVLSRTGLNIEKVDGMGTMEDVYSRVKENLNK